MEAIEMPITTVQKENQMLMRELANDAMIGNAASQMIKGIVNFSRNLAYMKEQSLANELALSNKTLKFEGLSNLKKTDSQKDAAMAALKAGKAYIDGVKEARLTISRAVNELDKPLIESVEALCKQLDLTIKQYEKQKQIEAEAERIRIEAESKKRIASIEAESNESESEKMKASFDAQIATQSIGVAEKRKYFKATFEADKAKKTILSLIAAHVASDSFKVENFDFLLKELSKKATDLQSPLPIEGVVFDFDVRA